MELTPNQNLNIGHLLLSLAIDYIDDAEAMTGLKHKDKQHFNKALWCLEKVNKSLNGIVTEEFIQAATGINNAILKEIERWKEQDSIK